MHRIKNVVTHMVFVKLLGDMRTLAAYPHCSHVYIYIRSLALQLQSTHLILLHNPRRSAKSESVK